MKKSTKPLLALIFLILPVTVLAAAAGSPGGSIEAIDDGKKISFPLLKSEFFAQVKGDLVTVTVNQTFANPADHAMHATYLFPLHEKAAVQRMRMNVGDEQVEAKIHRVEEANAIFNQAKRAGKAAALLNEHRPNMFTQNIANLMPGLPVKVSLTYCHTIPKVDGQYELVLPLIVGPRYQPGGSGAAPKTTADLDSKNEYGAWEVEKLPAYPEVASLNGPAIIDNKRVSLRIDLDGGMPVSEISSNTHSINVEKPSDIRRIVQLTDGKTIDNKDFVLRYRLSGQTAQAGLLAHRDERGGFFSIQLEPPAIPASRDIAAREMVFVLDTSGSMDGEPLAVSKVFMKHALNHLHSNDYFRIIRFSNNAEEFTAEPVAATADNIQAGLQFVDSLTADGGTEIPASIDQAFAKPPLENTLRLVVFLTDGYIGNESEVLGQIGEKIEMARIYALGVGTSVNRFLLQEMAMKGRGFARFIDPEEKSADAAIQLAGKLEAPVLTDIDIDWGGLEVSDMTPGTIPDLFAGSSVRIMGKYRQSGSYTVTVKGKINGRTAQLPVKVDLPDANDEPTNPLPVLWAQTRIAEAMHTITTPSYLRNNAESDDSLKQEVVDLGLNFSLMTPWTSFVAVSQKVVNALPELAQDKNVPLPMVAGISGKAYGPASETIAIGEFGITQQFSGGATPEPSGLAGLFIVSLLGAWTVFRIRRAQSNNA